MSTPSSSNDPQPGRIDRVLAFTAVVLALGLADRMLTFRLETMEEAKVILIFHVVGTIMEIFKTSVGSWIYPEDSVFRIGAVPLFSGFMYAAVGSYIAFIWALKLQIQVWPTFITG